MKRAFAEVDLSVLSANLTQVRSRLSSDIQIVGVVKADAYGHGAVSVVSTLQRDKVNYFAVAWLSEAEELRSNGITDPILLLSQPDPQYIPLIVKLKCVQTVYDPKFVRLLSTAAGAQKVSVHIKVDTGMNRIGVNLAGLTELLATIKSCPNIILEGIFSHFSCADEPKHPLNQEQIARFKQAQEIVKSIPTLKYIHLANSAGIANFPEAHFSMVRAGISLYRGVMSFKSHVMFVKDVPAGTPVSYNARFITKKPAQLATISVGYADGLSRALSGKGRVLIGGQYYPLVGSICMDMCLVDVTGGNVKLGDEVVLIGAQGNNVITAQELADLTGTIDYEIMCGISKRVPRIYKGAA